MYVNQSETAPRSFEKWVWIPNIEQLEEIIDCETLNDRSSFSLSNFITALYSDIMTENLINWTVNNSIE